MLHFYCTSFSRFPPTSGFLRNVSWTALVDSKVLAKTPGFYVIIVWLQGLQNITRSLLGHEKGHWLSSWMGKVLFHFRCASPSASGDLLLQGMVVSCAPEVNSDTSQMKVSFLHPAGPLQFFSRSDILVITPDRVLKIQTIYQQVECAICQMNILHDGSLSGFTQWENLKWFPCCPLDTPSEKDAAVPAKLGEIHFSVDIIS